MLIASSCDQRLFVTFPHPKCPTSKFAVDAVISHSPLFAFYNLDVSYPAAALFASTCLGLAVFVCAMLAPRQG